MELAVIGNKTRLDVVKEAIIDEINRMNFEKEVIKIGLVTFGSLVTLIGDGKTFKKPMSIMLFTMILTKSFRSAAK